MGKAKSLKPRLRQQVKEHNFLSILDSSEDEGFKIMCGVCSKSFSVRKTNHIPVHLRMISHVRATQLNKPKQTVPIPCPSGRPQKEDEFTFKFTEAWIEFGLPLSALLPGKKLRNVLEDGFCRPLPSLSTLASSYATAAFTKNVKN